MSLLLPAPEVCEPYSAVLPGNLLVTDWSMPDSSAWRYVSINEEDEWRKIYLMSSHLLCPCHRSLCLLDGRT